MLMQLQYDCMCYRYAASCLPERATYPFTPTGQALAVRLASRLATWTAPHMKLLYATQRTHHHPGAPIVCVSICALHYPTDSGTSVIAKVIGSDPVRSADRMIRNVTVPKHR